MSEEELIAIIEKVLSENSDAVQNYKSGKISSFEFLFGQVMRETRGKADTSTARRLLNEKLS
jgi:aspartyl-tRNA(Asn)/glutamyl-tRNA(Gln) amidotransferase subunit B